MITNHTLEIDMGYSRFSAMNNTAYFVKKMCYESNYSLSMFVQNFLLNDITKDRKSIIAYYYKGR